MYHRWRSGGREALVGAARLGRRSRLSDGQVDEVEEATLLAGHPLNVPEPSVIVVASTNGAE